MHAGDEASRHQLGRQKPAEDHPGTQQNPPARVGTGDSGDDAGDAEDASVEQQKQRRGEPDERAADQCGSHSRMITRRVCRAQARWYSCRHFTVSGSRLSASMAATAARKLVSSVKYGMPCMSVWRRML